VADDALKFAPVGAAVFEDLSIGAEQPTTANTAKPAKVVLANIARQSFVACTSWPVVNPASQSPVRVTNMAYCRT